MFVSKSKSFLICFVLYVLMIPCFSFLYQSAYEKQKFSFVVSTEVIEALFDEETIARKNNIDDLNRELKRYVEELEILMPAYESLQENHQIEYLGSSFVNAKAWNETHEIIIRLDGELGRMLEVGGLNLPVSSQILDFVRVGRAFTVSGIFFRNMDRVVKYLEGIIEKKRKK